MSCSAHVPKIFSGPWSPTSKILSKPHFLPIRTTMATCRTLIRTSLFSFQRLKAEPKFKLHSVPHNSSRPSLFSPLPSVSGFTSLSCSLLDPATSQSEDTVEDLLTRGDRIERLMKMERRPQGEIASKSLWFPYLDLYKVGSLELGSREIIEALDPYIMEARKERIRRAVENRSYSVCLVVEGLTDFGNVSAAFRSADALGIQSVHVISSDSKKRYKDNRHVSMGAEKWLDIELWNSPAECFEALKMRGFRIATTHLGMDTVSIYELDWSRPTAIVVGNENMGISEDALRLSDLHCSIPMNGMVDSFNVSVAAGILMHHAVCDRVSRQGRHGDLTTDQSQILVAEFFLRHRESTTNIVHEYAKRKVGVPISRL